MNHYHYTFDLARRISRVLEADYYFTHDLVLAHCFKCNLSDQAQQRLKRNSSFEFSDALYYVWQNQSLHRQIQAVESVDTVRDLFFRYVLEHPEDFRAEVVERFQTQHHELEPMDNLPRAIATLEISKLVGAVSRPAQEKNQFLGSQQFAFPTQAYNQPEAVIALRNYYHGCTLLCNCLRSRPDLPADQRQQLLQTLFCFWAPRKIQIFDSAPM